MKVINVTKSSMPDFNEYISEIIELWDSRRLTNMGAKHQQLQDELKTYLGVDHVELFTNGHMALELVIQAMGLTGEVITTPFTFASTTQAIVRNGLMPVFCDINPDDYTIDVTKIEKLITEKTVAIVPVHVYGNLCDVEEIQRIADKYGLKVIYDAAHTFGMRYKETGVGSFGDASCFSFHATKVFHTIEGGAVCYKDEALGQRLRQLRNFGMASTEEVPLEGLNAKMNEFSAAMGLCNLRHVDGEIRKRGEVVQRYRSRLSEIKGVTVCGTKDLVQENYAYFPILFDKKVFGADRDEVCQKLAESGIMARKYFYPLTNTFECYRGKFDLGETPVALKISEQVLTLPLYADLEISTVDLICDVICSCKK